jgi:hypothetical protein
MHIMARFAAQMAVLALALIWSKGVSVEDVATHLWPPNLAAHLLDNIAELDNIAAQFEFGGGAPAPALQVAHAAAWTQGQLGSQLGSQPYWRSQPYWVKLPASQSQ